MTTPDVSHRIIADLLNQHTGQQLTESRIWRIPSALAGIFRDRGISNVDQLVCILADPREAQLATQVVEALLNNETYFFRDRALFDNLIQHVLPDLAAKRDNRRRLSIWSAGCSTGQEALSLAMIFADERQRWADWQIDIVATDISSKAITAAKRACYNQFEVQRGNGVSQMLNYFTETEDGWQASDEIRAMIRFEQRNLLGNPPSPAQFDLVLCRNVLLYFDPETRRCAFDRLADALAGDGWLMLGAGETVVGQTDRFEPAGNGSTLYIPHRASGLRMAGGF